MSCSPAFAVLPTHLLDPSTSTAPHRFIRLPNPRTGLPSLYLPYRRPKDGKQGILEVQYIAPEDERSWFLGEEVVKDGRLMLLTPIDPVFLILPVLEATTASPSRFLLHDHIFSTAACHSTYVLPQAFPPASQSEGSKHNGTEQENSSAESKGEESEDVLVLGQIQGVEKWMKKVCEVKEIAPDLNAYRLSLPLLTAYLRKKVHRLAQAESFRSFPTLVRALAKDGLGDLVFDNTVGRSEDARIRLEAVRDEACLSHCLSLLQPYLLPTHFTHLTHSFCSHSSSSPDTPPTPFPLLQSHLLSLLPSIPSAADASSSTALSAAKSQASAAALKKTNSSQGVKKLKSVNTKGMADLRGFFGKKTTAEK